MAPTLGRGAGRDLRPGAAVGTPTPGASGQPGAHPATARAHGDGTAGAGRRRDVARAHPAGANQEFDAAQTAQQAGDWAEYGRQVKALQQTLAQLQALK